MNDETQDDILREMRGNEFDDPDLDAYGMIAARRLAKDWADRLDAARRREKPINVAALREALEAVSEEFSCGTLGAVGDCPSHHDLQDAKAVWRKVDAALAAPARNCDRFRTELDAQLAFLNDVWLISVEKETMQERDKFENWTEQMKTCYGRWLLAPAKEGGVK